MIASDKEAEAAQPRPRANRQTGNAAQPLIASNGEMPAAAPLGAAGRRWTLKALSAGKGLSADPGKSKF
jgi:hypothetical protein